MNVEVNVNITVESSGNWQYQLFDAMHNIGSSIMNNPEFNQGRGDSNTYTYEYTIKGTGGLK